LIVARYFRRQPAIKRHTKATVGIENKDIMRMIANFWSLFDGEDDEDGLQNCISIPYERGQQ
jgi:hypothetical protein